MTNDEKILAVLEKHGELLTQLAGDVSGLKTDVSGLKADVSEMNGRLSRVESDVSGLKADMSNVKDNVASIKEDVTKVEVILENRIEPHIQTLAEGHTTLLQTLAPLSRVQDLEDEIRNRDIAKKIVTTFAAKSRA